MLGQGAEGIWAAAHDALESKNAIVSHCIDCEVALPKNSRPGTEGGVTASGDHQGEASPHRGPAGNCSQYR